MDGMEPPSTETLPEVPELSEVGGLLPVLVGLVTGLLQLLAGLLGLPVPSLPVG